MADRISDQCLAAQHQEVARQRAGDSGQTADQQGRQRKGNEVGAAHVTTSGGPMRGIQIGDLVSGQHVLDPGQAVIAGRRQLQVPGVARAISQRFSSRSARAARALPSSVGTPSARARPWRFSSRSVSGS